jgi:hypothetical protein
MEMGDRTSGLIAPFGRLLEHSVDRRVALRGIGGGLVAALLPANAWRRVAAQDPVEIGVAPEGGIAWEAIGKIDQAGADFTAYGYLTHVAGLEEARLYLEGGVPLVRTEATARFTFFAPAVLLARSELENLIVVSAEGEQAIYFNEAGGARFDRPESFFGGVEIARSAIRFHSTLNVQAANSGIATGIAEIIQTAAEPFAFDGEEVRFGHAGLRTRLQTTGQATRTEATLPRSSMAFAGAAIVLGDDAGPGLPAATPAAGAEVESAWDLISFDRLPARVLREDDAETGTLTLTLPEALGGGTVTTAVTSGEGGQIGTVEADGDDLLFTFTEVTYDVEAVEFPLGIEFGPGRITLDPDQPSTLRVDRETDEIARDFHWLLTAEGSAFDGEETAAFGDTAASEVVGARRLDEDRIEIILRTHWTSEIPLTSLEIGGQTVDAGLIDAAADFEGAYILDFS